MYKAVCQCSCSSLLPDLLERALNPDILKMTIYELECTFLYRAVLSNNIKGVEILLEHKADPNFQQFVPLHQAIYEQNINIVKLLVEAKADLETKDHIRQTSIHLATYANLDILSYVCEASKDVSILNDNQETALHYLCQYDECYFNHNQTLEMVIYLLKLKCDPSLKNHQESRLFKTIF